jgi:hypothetical protein
MDATQKTLVELTRKVDHLNQMVSDMRKEKLKERKTAKKETWVKVGTIRKLTIWDDKRKLERARREGLLIQRKGANGIEYLIESIDPLFIRKQAS